MLRLRDRATTWALRVSLLLSVVWCAAADTGARMPFGAFAAADLDGDRQADFATPGAMRHDASGYVLDISVRLSAAESGIITVRTTRAAGRISARDLDGDADRDLILESFDREPLAIVLNDGGGHFHQVSLDTFGALAHRPEPQTFEKPAWNDDSPETGESNASPAVAPATLASRPAAVRAQRLRPRGQRRLTPEYSARASRAPPALL
jgi:hypothetical protein